MRSVILYFLIALTVLSLTGCGAKEVPAETMSALTPAVTVVPETTEAATEPAQLTNAQLAENTAKDFALAYFAGDKDAMKLYLTDPFDWSLDTYPDDGRVVTDIYFQGFHGAQPMDEASENCVASVQFRETAESDSYTYLTIEMMKQDGQWKVSFYGLEK